MVERFTARDVVEQEPREGEGVTLEVFEMGRSVARPHEKRLSFVDSEKNR